MNFEWKIKSGVRQELKIRTKGAIQELQRLFFGTIIGLLVFRFGRYRR